MSPTVKTMPVGIVPMTERNISRTSASEMVRPGPSEPACQNSPSSAKSAMAPSISPSVSKAKNRRVVSLFSSVTAHSAHDHSHGANLHVHRDLQVGERFGHDTIAFLRASGSTNHHDLALLKIGPNAADASPRAVGLFHTAWEVDGIGDLVAARARLVTEGCFDSQADHGATRSVYGSDPDGNTFEIMWTMPREARGVGLMGDRRADQGADGSRRRTRPLGPAGVGMQPLLVSVPRPVRPTAQACAAGCGR